MNDSRLHKIVRTYYDSLFSKINTVAISLLPTRTYKCEKTNETKRKKRDNRTGRQIEDDSTKRRKLCEEMKNKKPNNKNISYQQHYHKNITKAVRARKNKTSTINNLATRQKNKDELIVVYDHNDINNGKDIQRYYTTSYNFGFGEGKQSNKARDQSRIFLYSMFGSTQTITHLRHLGDPHVDGYYKKYEEKKLMKHHVIIYCMHINTMNQKYLLQHLISELN